MPRVTCSRKNLMKFPIGNGSSRFQIWLQIHFIIWEWNKSRLLREQAISVKRNFSSETSYRQQLTVSSSSHWLAKIGGTRKYLNSSSFRESWYSWILFNITPTGQKYSCCWRPKSGESPLGPNLVRLEEEYKNVTVVIGVSVKTKFFIDDQSGLFMWSFNSYGLLPK